MKKLNRLQNKILIALFLVTLFACDMNNMNKQDLSNKIDKLEVEVEKLREGKLIGTYIGDFGSNFINITLVQCENGIAKGYSVCAGNDRDILGVYHLIDDDLFMFELNEPGDNKYDGTFKFQLNINTETIQGTWSPYKKIVESKNFLLVKKSFQYNINHGNFSFASKRYLSEEELLEFDLNALGEMRNEIYARHGYSFKTKSWRHHFENKDWYIPTRTDIRDDLTKIEKKNISLIKELEEYWEIEYDNFGR